MAETSVIRDWIASSISPDMFRRAAREMYDASTWTLMADVFSAARQQGALLYTFDRQVVDVNARELAIGALKVWMRSRSPQQTSAIPDWHPPKDWRDDLASEIDAYKSRVAGWDGYSAAPIDPVAIVDAIAFVRSLPAGVPPPIDQPCSDGEISLVWRIGNKFADVAFAGDQKFSWYATNGREEGSGEDLPIDFGLPVDLERIMGFANERLGSVTTSSAPIEYHWLPFDFARFVSTEASSAAITSIAPRSYRDQLEPAA